MSSLYDKLVNVDEKNVTRQELYNIVVNHFNDETETKDWLHHIETQLKKIFDIETTNMVLQTNSNIKEVINNKADYIHGQSNMILLHYLLGIVADKTNIINYCIDNNIFQKHVKRLSDYMISRINKTDIFLLAFYDVLKYYDSRAILNTLSIMLLTFQNINYYLSHYNLYIHRSERKKPVVIGKEKQYKKVYTYGAPEEDLVLTKNYPRKIIFDYVYSEGNSLDVRSSYYTY